MGNRAARFLLLAALLGGALAIPVWLVPALRDAGQREMHGRIIHERISDFSHIRIRERDGVRSLHFVDDEGREQQQSAIDLTEPGELQLRYTRTLFASLLFQEPQERVLIVGLGGGGMVRFLEEAFPETRIEVVEIDPEVIDVAETYFGTEEGPRTVIHEADAFEFFRDTHGPYDAIYLDAFLRPPEDSGLKRVTRRLKTASFLEKVRGQLEPGGLVAFNLVRSDPSTPADLEVIRDVFPSVYLFDVPGRGNLVAIASLEEVRLSETELLSRARRLERALDADLPFRDFVRDLEG